MADIRIKDLATLESASLTGDVFVIDGTTGTRKLNAFSPTFGGNATVTGTLTVNSTITAANTIKYVNSGVANGTTVAPLQADIGADGTLGALQVSIGGSPSATGASRFGYVGAGDVGAWRTFIVGSNTSSGGGQVLVPSTLSSTTTSSGALVVSGGVGVAGAINAGGNIVLSPASVAASGEVGNLRIADSSNTNRKLFFGLDNTVSPNGVGYIQSTLTGTTTIPLQLQPLGGSLSVGNSGTVVTLNGTTASTSTSSGALVVSGGVGVAGALYVGSATESTSNTTGGLVVSGGLGLALNLNMGGRLFINNTGASNGTLSAAGMVATFGADNLAFGVKGFPSATAGSRYIQLAAGDSGDYREIRINDLGGNVLLGGATSTVKIGGSFQVGNAYVAGAPTATGYIVIKDSTGTSYKIPAVAL
jgi:hypothetical protein